MMMHQLLSPPTNRRFFTLFRRAFFRPRKWHDANVAWEQQWKLMSTAATSEIPNNNVRTKRRAVSPNQRRKMVEAYVNEYRVMNDDRFPTTSNVQKHVGGSYYYVKVILQEYEHCCKLSAVAAATKTSTTGQTAPVNGISDSGIACDSQLPDDRTAVVKDCGISVELLSNCKVGVDKSSHENMDDVSTLNKHYKIATASVSGRDRKVDFELGGECGKTFGDMDMRDKNNNLEIPGVPVTLSSVEDTLAHETLMALAMDDPEFLAKPSHHPKVTGTSRNPEPQEIDKSADQALESDESKGVMDIEKLSTVLSEKTQGGASYNNSSAITQELDNSTVRAEMELTSDIGMPLDCELRIGRIAAKNDCQVSTDNDSSSQKADNCSCQMMIDESIVSENKEVTADDVHGREKTVDLKLMREHQKTSSTNVDGGDYIRSLESEELSQQPNSMMDTSAVSSKATSSENGEVSSTPPSLLSEVPATSPNLDIDETVSSAQASNSGEISRGTMDKKLQESSLWVNVKLLASNIMSFWRKS